MGKKQRRVTVVSALVLVLALLLTACGGDDDDGDSGSKSESYTVGIVNPSSGLVRVVEGFKAGMAERGYVEGDNVTYIDAGPLGSDQAAWEAALQALIDQKVDLIVTMGTPMSQKAQSMTDTIPVLFMPITDPVAAGLADSISAPGGNLTGMSVAGQDLPRLDWLKKAAPEIETVYVVYNPSDEAPTSILPDLREGAEKLGMTLVEVEAPDAAAMEDAAINVPDDVDAIFVMPDSMAIANIPNFRESALRLKIPLASIPLFGADLGVLITYGFDPFELGRTSSRLGVEILRGANPAELPVETAEFYLTINLQTAEAIELAVSNQIVDLATTVIRVENN